MDPVVSIRGKRYIDGVEISKSDLEDLRQLELKLEAKPSEGK